MLSLHTQCPEGEKTTTTSDAMQSINDVIPYNKKGVIKKKKKKRVKERKKIGKSNSVQYSSLTDWVVGGGE